MNPYPVRDFRESPVLLVVLLILLALLLPFLASRTGLFDLDEGFYASTAQEMVRTGNYVTPMYAGSPFLEKPPLLYWLMAAFLKMGLSPTLAVRMPSILSALILLAAVGIASLRRGGGAVVVAALAISPLFLGLAHLAFTDMLFTCCLTLCFLLFWYSISGAPEWLRIPSAAFLGLATLTKGPAAAVLFLLLAGITFATQPQLREGFRKHWLEAALVYLLVAAPWYVLIYKQQGKEFFQEFIIRQNLGRFGGGDAAHLAPIYFYIPILVVGFFPWSFYLPGVFARAPGDPFYRFCLTWAAIVFVLFSISGTKLPSYVLPMFPALALLLPVLPAEIRESASPTAAFAKPFWIALVVAALFGFALYHFRTAKGVSESVGEAMLWASYILIGSVALAAGLRRIMRPEIACVAGPVILGAALSLSAAIFVVPAYYESTQRDSREVADWLADHTQPLDTYCLYRVSPGRPSVMFYTGRQGVGASEFPELQNQIKVNPSLLVVTELENQRQLASKGLATLFQSGQYVVMQPAVRPPSP
jgi:4-amino-4-deoxy-L-arabinose transferase-like glycosyltransferase